MENFSAVARRVELDLLAASHGRRRVASFVAGSRRAVRLPYCVRTTDNANRSVKLGMRLK